MLSKNMVKLGKNRSTIREMFEYGKKRKAVVGEDNVFDFSIGNPSVPAPKEITEQLKRIISEADPVALHGYTSAQGDASTREAIVKHIKNEFGFNASSDLIYVTAGAAAALSICFNALATGNDEIIIIAPYFPEYRVFIEAAHCDCVVVPSNSETLLPDMDALEGAINMHTKAVVINSPNNPSGAVYPKRTIKELTDILKRKSGEYAHPIFLISDEPYRDLVYDGITVPYAPNYYDNTLICYSYSKVWSIPGERIGYIAVNPSMEHCDDVFSAICGAGRTLGYVCAPSLFQRLIADCASVKTDMSVYKKNRDLLYGALCEMGFSCVHPDGAFYLFVRSPIASAAEFCEKAKDYELLLVPAEDFGCEGFLRISYCVSTEMIERSLPAFKKLAEFYKLI